jgi:hypothetical protein
MIMQCLLALPWGDALVSTSFEQTAAVKCVTGLTGAHQRPPLPLHECLDLGSRDIRHIAMSAVEALLRLPL